jgi:hypothetical protein
MDQLKPYDILDHTFLDLGTLERLKPVFRRLRWYYTCGINHTPTLWWQYWAQGKGLHRSQCMLSLLLNQNTPDKVKKIMSANMKITLWQKWYTCISKHHTFWRGPARRKWTPRGLFFWTTTCGSTKSMLFTDGYCIIVIFLAKQHDNINVWRHQLCHLPFQVLYHLRGQNIAWWNCEENIQFNR